MLDLQEMSSRIDKGLGTQADLQALYAEVQRLYAEQGTKKPQPVPAKPQAED